MQSSKEDIRGFLHLCAKYAEDSLTRKRSRGDLEAEISSWENYLKFTQHTISEINQGKLDHWMKHLSSDDEWRPSPTPPPTSSPTTSTTTSTSNQDADDSIAQTMVELKELEFMPRKFLIDGLIGPRPLAIASTKSNAGLNNLAGITSVCVVSNQPPLLTISLSQYLDGRPRDTLTNLRENGKVTLHILPPTQEMAEITDVVSKPLPRDTSEWDSLTLSPVESPSGECWPPLLPKSVAAFECQVIEILDLPKDGVAKLCVLEIERVIAAEKIIDMAKSGSSIATLCQHRTLRIGPSPESWNYLCDIF